MPEEGNARFDVELTNHRLERPALRPFAGEREVCSRNLGNRGQEIAVTLLLVEARRHENEGRRRSPAIACRMVAIDSAAGAVGDPDHTEFGSTSILPGAQWRSCTRWRRTLSETAK
jgi:hypothetical protein